MYIAKTPSAYFESRPERPESGTAEWAEARDYFGYNQPRFQCRFALSR